MSGRVCPACGQTIRADRYACPVDWARLPGDLKREISIAWGRYRTLFDRSAALEEIEAAAARHDAAKAAADAWLQAHPR